MCLVMYLRVLKLSDEVFLEFPEITQILSDFRKGMVIFLAFSLIRYWSRCRYVILHFHLAVSYQTQESALTISPFELELIHFIQ